MTLVMKGTKPMPTTESERLTKEVMTQGESLITAHCC